eukprot:162780_1
MLPLIIGGVVKSITDNDKKKDAEKRKRQAQQYKKQTLNVLEHLHTMMDKSQKEISKILNLIDKTNNKYQNLNVKLSVVKQGEALTRDMKNILDKWDELQKQCEKDLSESKDNSVLDDVLDVSFLLLTHSILPGFVLVPKIVSIMTNNVDYKSSVSELARCIQSIKDKFRIITLEINDAISKGENAEEQSKFDNWGNFSNDFIKMMKECSDILKGLESKRQEII